jgi:hypothetical protein
VRYLAVWVYRVRIWHGQQRRADLIVLFADGIIYILSSI